MDHFYNDFFFSFTDIICVNLTYGSGVKILIFFFFFYTFKENTKILPKRISVQINVKHFFFF